MDCFSLNAQLASQQINLCNIKHLTLSIIQKMNVISRSLFSAISSPFLSVHSSPIAVKVNAMVKNDCFAQQQLSYCRLFASTTRKFRSVRLDVLFSDKVNS